MKSRAEKAAELSASRAWPHTEDPEFGKMSSLNWMSHREGFLLGVEWARQTWKCEKCRGKNANVFDHCTLCGDDLDE